MNAEHNGYIRVLNIRGTPIFIHWNFPIVGIFISAYMGFNIWEAASFCLGYLLLIAWHETGHMLAAWQLGLKVSGIYILCAV